MKSDMAIYSSYLVRKLLAYTVFALVLLVLAFYTYRHERQNDKKAPVINESLYLLNPMYTNTYQIT